MEIAPSRPIARDIQQNLARVIRGKNDAIRKAIICLLCEGHLLIDDIPGVGKTSLALALAKSLDLSFQRIQFTSDLFPADILGVSIYNPKTGEFDFKTGPIFHNVILADEINRSTPKSQSALLEVMNERQITIDNRTRPIPRPFFVIATQNPFEHYGTYPLPESQKDRFLMRVSMGYPEPKDEKEILRENIGLHSVQELKCVAQKEQVLNMISEVKTISVTELIDDYILKIVGETRRSPFLELGASPRGALSLRAASQANAYMEGRNFVIPDDVKFSALPVLAHRVILKSVNSDSELKQSEIVIQEILDRTTVPI